MFPMFSIESETFGKIVVRRRGTTQSAMEADSGDVWRRNGVSNCRLPPYTHHPKPAKVYCIAA